MHIFHCQDHCPRLCISCYCYNVKLFPHTILWGKSPLINYIFIDIILFDMYETSPFMVRQYPVQVFNFWCLDEIEESQSESDKKKRGSIIWHAIITSLIFFLHHYYGLFVCFLSVCSLNFFFSLLFVWSHAWSFGDWGSITTLTIIIIIL